MNNSDPMYTNFYAERAAKNIPQLSAFEEEALKKSPEFRKKVVDAFKKVNGPGSELKIQIERGILLLSWFRTTNKIFSLIHEDYNAAKLLVINIYKIIIEEAEKKRQNLGKFKTDEWTQFISSIMKKSGNPPEFIQRTYDEKFLLFGCRLDAAGEKRPLILITNLNSEKYTIDIGLLVSIYSVENTMYNIPNVILLSNYRVIPDSDSLKPDYIPIGFSSPTDLWQIIKWYKQ